MDSEIKLFLKVGAGLMGLLALTIIAAMLPLGGFGQLVALAIAVTKALLVVLYFMELRHSEHVVWIWVVAGVLWLGLLFVGVFSDVATRLGS